MDNLFQKNVSLKPYNTFGIDVKAAQFFSAKTVEDLREALLNAPGEKFILGGGSNMLLTREITSPVIHIALKGIEIISQTKEKALVRVAGGESWHEFVLWAIANDLGGVENMSLIPGNTGTAPVQNIGAYGVELKDVFHSCEAMSVSTGDLRTFTLEECQFGYRDSIFKREIKGQYVITSVTMELTTKGHHKINTAYGAITNELERMGINNPEIGDVSRAVIAIRQSKLPDPAQLGNSGSFFKNPILPKATFEKLLENSPELPHYPAGTDMVKVPAGWLIDQCGLKGYREGDAGVHEKQALVLVNHGNASGSDILRLSRYVQEKVQQTYGISITPEVNIF
ncbi:UDP-N-acetylmuramate dehydrogenase [Robertkochia sediminum]|uniref:UDP-N-acetylmuramate dehydrogenase n=1 Tax=Robertkochia sediminum TaxID=2785326 RepID=UPI0019339235|nr:UDP-N-acetylmuramate dehydrogenase [Robertkochia sediminum]MBL7471653.1 UDP-N-acetylmuramate dehydrogenase [Robertkochia sediminum]